MRKLSQTKKWTIFFTKGDIWSKITVADFLLKNFFFFCGRFWSELKKAITVFSVSRLEMRSNNLSSSHLFNEWKTSMTGWNHQFMFGFEPRIFGVRSDRSSNWATTTALHLTNCAWANFAPAQLEIIFKLSNHELRCTSMRESVEDTGLIKVRKRKKMKKRQAPGRIQTLEDCALPLCYNHCRLRENLDGRPFGNSGGCWHGIR